MRANQSISLLCVALLGISFIWAQEETTPAEKSPLISEINITGLKKTRNTYMQQVLKKFKDIPEAELDLQAVQLALQEQGLFSKTDVHVDHNAQGEPFLAIAVEEKISFIPLPFASYSSGGFLGGLMVMDTNAFGVKDNYVLGGIFSKNLLMGISSFSKPSLSRKQPGFSVSVSGAKSTTECTDSDEETILEYDSTGVSASFSVSDKISDHSQISAGVRYNYTNFTVDDAYPVEQAAFDNFHAVSVNGGWRLTLPLLNDWFLSTKSMRVSGELQFLTTGKNSQSTTGQLAIQQPLPLSRLRLLGQISGYYGHNIPTAQFPTQSAVGITIMPGKYHSPRMAGAHAGIEFGLAKTTFATFSVYGLYEQFIAEDIDEKTLINYGYSVGAKMYLAKIAFPALALGIAHNLSKNNVQFAAAFGVTF